MFSNKSKDAAPAPQPMLTAPVPAPRFSTSSHPALIDVSWLAT